METSASLKINATKEQVWAVVTDIDSAKQRIECILDIEVLERPDSGIVGLKWRETREMFGKQATETMWITEAKDNEYYVTEAENSGCLYHSTIRIIELEDGVELAMSFKATPLSLFAKIMSPMMFMMKGMIKKAFEKDLRDIKNILEN